MGAVASSGQRTATHKGVITFLPDVRWEAPQQLEPVVLRLPKSVQDGSFQSSACCCKSYDGGFRVQSGEDACNSFDDPFLLKQSGDPVSLRPQHRVRGGRLDDLVAGMGHIRAIVVAGESKNSMYLVSRG